MNVAILKYNAGNICSVINAVRRLGIEPIVTDKAEELKSSDRILFPGQGEAVTTMGYLKEHKLDTLLLSLKQPVLGICIGQQLMCAHSEEGNVDCLGIFNVNVKRFIAKKQTDKIPHMGWNNLSACKGELFKNMPDDPFVYFIHSFYVPLCEYTIAQTDYIQPFSAAIRKNNFFATQFHPEKSGSIGEKILQNFLDFTL